MLAKQSKSVRNVKKSTAAAGIVLSLALLGAGGCATTTTATAASTPTSSTSASASTASSQQAQGQTKPGAALRNPAIRAVMEIRSLENNKTVPLTADQKSQLKPILQTLINTTNPSQDFLQQQAAAITAVFTTEQKSVLTQRKPPQGNQPNRNTQNGTASGGNNSANGTTPGGSAGRSRGPNSQRGTAIQPTQIYQQVLSSLG